MLENVHGHDKVTQYLRQLVAGGDLPSSVLFYGPEGVGKRMTALEVAKGLNCLREGISDCSCNSCRKINEGNHLDVLSYQPDGTTFKIDQVRDLINESTRYRMEGRHRVFILEDAHLLNQQAGDALLKTLEEGIEHTLFVLLSRSKEEVVPTLVSRSLDFYFGHLLPQDLKQILLEIGIPTSEEILRLAQGSVSKALYFAEGAGLTVRREVLDLLVQYPSIRDYLVIAKVKEYKDREIELLQMVQLLLMDSLAYQNDSRQVIVNQDIPEEIARLSDVLGPKCFDAISVVRKCLQRQDQSVAFDHHAKSTLLHFKDLLR